MTPTERARERDEVYRWMFSHGLGFRQACYLRWLRWLNARERLERR